MVHYNQWLIAPVQLIWPNWDGPAVDVNDLQGIWPKFFFPILLRLAEQAARLCLWVGSGLYLYNQNPAIIPPIQWSSTNWHVFGSMFDLAPKRVHERMELDEGLKNMTVTLDFCDEAI